MPLSHLKLGQKAEIVSFGIYGQSLIRFMEMGWRARDPIQMIGQLPLGGNLIVLSHHGKYIIRKKDAQLIKVKPTAEPGHNRQWP